MKTLTDKERLERCCVAERLIELHSQLAHELQESGDEELAIIYESRVSDSARELDLLNEVGELRWKVNKLETEIERLKKQGEKQ
jgi:uncharacterized small protein (DUF1192 family)